MAVFLVNLFIGLAAARSGSGPFPNCYRGAWVSTCCLRRAAHTVPSPPLLSHLTAPTPLAGSSSASAVPASPLKSESALQRHPQNGRTFREEKAAYALCD